MFSLFLPSIRDHRGKMLHCYYRRHFFLINVQTMFYLKDVTCLYMPIVVLVMFVKMFLVHQGFVYLPTVWVRQLIMDLLCFYKCIGSYIRPHANKKKKEKLLNSISGNLFDKHTLSIPSKISTVDGLACKANILKSKSERRNDDICETNSTLCASNFLKKSGNFLLHLPIFTHFLYVTSVFFHCW